MRKFYKKSESTAIYRLMTIHILRIISVFLVSSDIRSDAK